MFNNNSQSDVKRTFLLVHGAWHGGWCYRRVADILRSRGHRVFTPTLTGVAERSHLLSRSIDVDFHATDIVNLMQWEELDDIVLVGHSYGGMVIAAVAERVPVGAINTIVFLDAFIPQDGDCVFDLVVRRAEDKVAWMEAGVMPPVPAAMFNVNLADQALVDRLCTPHPTACFSQKLALTGAYERIPHKICILAENGRFPAAAAALAHRPDWHLVTMEGGHDLMLDAPAPLADALEQAPDAA